MGRIVLVLLGIGAALFFWTERGAMMRYLKIEKM